MNEALSINQTRIRSACDECYRVKRGCDLSIPTCSRCKGKGKICTRERQNNRRPKMNNNDDFHSKMFLLSQPSKAKKEIKVRNTIVINNRYFNQFKIPSGGDRFDSSVSVASIFPIKMYHSTLIFNQSTYFLYKIAPNQFLIKFFSKMPPVESGNKIMKRNINVHYSVPQLIYAYFERINIMLPLFTCSIFFSKKRDIRLIYSIMLVTLTQTSCGENLTYLKAFLKHKLLKHFHPSRLKIKLSSIQSMVILLNGLKGSSLALPSYYFSNLHNYCILLGLHLNHKNSIERKLCYSAVLYLLSFDDPYSNFSFDTHDLWKQDNAVLALKKNESIESIMKSIFLVYSSYCYKCGLLYKNFFDTTMHINILNITNAKALKIGTLLIALLNHATEMATAKYSIIKRTISNKILYETIDIITSHIKIIHHSTWILLHNILCLASNSNKENLFSRYILRNKPKDMDLLEENIQSFIVYSFNLKSKYYSSIRLFTFLLVINSISSYSKWITNASTLLDQVLSQFDNLTKDNNMGLVSAINRIIQVAIKK
ncbi:hypothetical protein K502DRAFT_353226 [Neoconidiobolus thromboides FSU 785]|nr:hypothetical protein K502DRAFT_353226 [Neoconidiobolus thromboides FSU 785]